MNSKSFSSCKINKYNTNKSKKKSIKLKNKKKAKQNKDKKKKVPHPLSPYLSINTRSLIITWEYNDISPAF